MLNRERDDEECDARDDDSSNAVGKPKKISNVLLTEDSNGMAGKFE